MKPSCLCLSILMLASACSSSGEKNPSTETKSAPPEEVKAVSRVPKNDYSPLFTKGRTFEYQLHSVTKDSEEDQSGGCTVDRVILDTSANPQKPKKRSHISCKTENSLAGLSLDAMIGGCWLIGEEGLFHNADCDKVKGCSLESFETTCGLKLPSKRAPIEKPNHPSGHAKGLKGEPEPEIYRNENGSLCYHQWLEEKENLSLTYCFSDLKGIEEIRMAELSGFLQVVIRQVTNPGTSSGDSQPSLEDRLKDNAPL